MPPTRWLLAIALPLLGACHSESQELLPRLKPLLETLPAHYRPLNRQDTLASYWIPDSVATDSLFTPSYRSQIVMRVQFVPASVAAATRLDTLRFRQPALQAEEYKRPGYHWNFSSSRSPVTDLTTAAQDVPLHLALSYLWSFTLLERRRWRYQDPDDARTYERNEYTMIYPFGVAAAARVSDSVAYVRVFPMRPHQSRPDTLYSYYAHGLPIQLRAKRIPCVADQPDTTRQALLRLSFRVIQHSANLE
jgi:hypothetical protein